MKATGIVRRIDDLGRIVVPQRNSQDTAHPGGGSLEIFTSREGEIMLKKYSLTGWGTGRVCTKLCTGTGTDHRGSGLHYGSGICDRSSGNREKKEVEGEQLSEEMEAMIEKRSTVVKTGEEQACSITKKNNVNTSEGNCAFKYSVQWRLSGCCDSGR